MQTHQADPQLTFRPRAGLAAEGRAWLALLRGWELPLLLLVYALGMGAAVQGPLHYTFDVGREEAYGGDLPLLSGFNTPEADEHGTYRWTRDQAEIRLPGLGQRAVTLRLAFFPISTEVLAVGPHEIELWVHDELLVRLPVRQAGAHYHVRVPARLLPQGDLTVLIRTATFVPPDPDDPRALGTPLDRVTVTAAAAWPTLPATSAGVMYLLATIVLWATLLRALAPSLGHAAARWWALRLLGGAVLLLLLAAVLDPPRWAFGAWPLLLAALLGYALLLLLRWALPPLAARLDVPLAARTLGWLLLLAVLVFGLRYGGRLYPNSMHGDIGFHTNRTHEVLSRGWVYLVSRNRGVDFPYPPGPYLLLAPATLLPIEPPVLLEFGAALVDALSVVLVYTIVARVAGASQHWRGRSLAPTQARGPPRVPTYERVALLAAALYGLTAAGVMLTWWSFDTHIYSQFFTLLLLTTLHLIGVHYVLYGTPPRWRVRRQMLALVVLAGLVFLGHFGFFINTTLLGGLLVLALLWAGWRGVGWAWQASGRLALVGGVAVLGALALFYSAYWWLFAQQLAATAEGGLTGLAERAPVSRARLWEVLWEAGMIQHFGFFPLALAPIGIWAIGRLGPPARLAQVVMASSLLVSLVFAVLPFLTLSTQSTRWLMFSAWAIMIGAALAFWLYRQRGRAGRLVVLAMLGYVLWNTLVFWLGPMLWRIRPPEPF